MLPCNTLHSLFPRLREISKLPLIDLIEEVSTNIKQNYQSIGILSTSKTRQDGLYDKQLEEIKLIYPSDKEQVQISEIIIRIIHNKVKEEDKIFLDNIIQSLIPQGAEKVLLACTDLGQVIRNNPNIIDSTDILIEAIKSYLRK